MKIQANINTKDIDFSKLQNKVNTNITKIVDNSNNKEITYNNLLKNNNAETIDLNIEKVGAFSDFFSGIWAWLDRIGKCGGNQSSLKEHSDYFISLEEVQNIVHKYYPEATEEDMELLFSKMELCGCGYVASINTIFFEYANRENGEEEFERIFGFPMKTNGVYNYELLFLDFFLYCSYYENDYITIEEAYGNIAEEMEVHNGDSALSDEEFSSTGMDGTNMDILPKMFEDYMASKGIIVNAAGGAIHRYKDGTVIDEWPHGEKLSYGPINLDINSKTYDVYKKKLEDEGYKVPEGEPLSIEHIDIDLEIMKALLEDGKKIIVSSNDFDLYNPVTDEKKYEDVGSHAMTVLDVDVDNNKILISSWGKSYELDLNEDDLSGIIVYDFD